jgi:hypothetical protein
MSGPSVIAKSAVGDWRSVPPSMSICRMNYVDALLIAIWRAPISRPPRARLGCFSLRRRKPRARPAIGRRRYARPKRACSASQDSISPSAISRFCQLSSLLGAILVGCEASRPNSFQNTEREAVRRIW